MIPQSYITAWRKKAPWQEDFQVEQDMVIERALIEIYNEPFLKERLAFRGGTALHKLYLSPAARYSEDIDLVQIKAESFGPVIDKLRETLFFLGTPVRKQKKHKLQLLKIFGLKSKTTNSVYEENLLIATYGFVCSDHF